MRKPGTLDDVDEAVADDTALRAVQDLHGAPVEDASGIRIGTLFGALAEADTGLLRYLDLALDTLDRHVLIPIGHARVREPKREEPHVRLRAAMLEELERIPPFAADVAHVTDPFERALLEAYGRTFHGERYYAHPAYDHAGLFVGEHPVVGPAVGDGELRPLADLPGWQVARGEPDLRGWTLQFQDGVGAVLDLIVDVAAHTVRYLAVSPPGESAPRLLPIGYLTVDRHARTVDARVFMLADVISLPAWDRTPVTRAVEDELQAALRARFTGPRRYLLADFRRV